MEDQAGVDKAVLSRVAGRAQHDIRFGFLVRERDGGGAISQAADDDHEERGQNLWDTEGNVGDDRP